MVIILLTTFQNRLALSLDASEASEAFPLVRDPIVCLKACGQCTLMNPRRNHSGGSQSNVINKQCQDRNTYDYS